MRELGSTSALMKKEVAGSTPSTKEVTMTLKLLSQEGQGTTVNPTYSSSDEYKISSTPRKERNSKVTMASFGFLSFLGVLAILYSSLLEYVGVTVVPYSS